MNNLPSSTLRRLARIDRVPSIWEGDRRPMGGLARELDPEISDENGDCIIWVDASEGLVRAMDVVSPEMGHEAVVRTLLRAIENPHNPARPARPQRIVVRDREIHFFLRGMLQELEIDIDYVPELPLIDELFRGFEQMGNSRPPRLPRQFAHSLREAASELWKTAPWEWLGDHHIISIALNRWDIGTLYVSVMGMLGQEYGALFYRSLESLERFREAAISERSPERLEKAFLSQDCWYVNYETDADDFEDSEDDLADWPFEDIYAIFGSVHPYEGMRPFLDEEEAIAVYAALKALIEFAQAKEKLLMKTEDDYFPLAKKRCRVVLPSEYEESQTLSIQVETMPELSNRLLDMMDSSDFDLDDDEEEEEEDSTFSIPIQGDLIPEGALIWPQIISDTYTQLLRAAGQKYYPSEAGVAVDSALPIITVQSSRPKVKAMVQQIQESGGAKAICFNQVADPLTNTIYDLGLLQTRDGSIYLFEEFEISDPAYHKIRPKWDKCVEEANGFCGLVLAMGITGASRGKPRERDILALFEVKVISPQELGSETWALMKQSGLLE